MMNQLQNIYHAKAPDIISPIQNNTQFYRTVLFENVVESVIALLNAYHAKHDGFPEEISEHCAWAENLELSRELSPDDAERLHRIWQHKPMRQSFRKLSKEFYIPDSTPYYLKNVGRFCAEDFEPSSEDRLMSRIRTMGVRTKQFPHPPVRFEFVDVGGQRNERRKWVRYCFFKCIFLDGIFRVLRLLERFVADDIVRSFGNELVATIRTMCLKRINVPLFEK